MCMEEQLMRMYSKVEQKQASFQLSYPAADTGPYIATRIWKETPKQSTSARTRRMG